jgi:N6-adenosine-specific RNA methylase IME4
MSKTPPFPNKKYDIIYTDPPWHYYGSTTKDAAAGKHYDLMLQDDIEKLPVKDLLNPKGACFVWATGPRLDYALSAINAWGLHYRGVAHVWVKTRKDGKIIHGQGVPPTYSKPTTELLLLATTVKKGRPLPLLDKALPQVVLAPREAHSKKPAIFRELIEKAYGDCSRLEMFARGKVKDWDVWGNQAEK